MKIKKKKRFLFTWKTVFKSIALIKMSVLLKSLFVL